MTAPSGTEREFTPDRVTVAPPPKHAALPLWDEAPKQTGAIKAAPIGAAKTVGMEMEAASPVAGAQA